MSKVCGVIYTNILNILWEHLVQFKMNPMNTRKKKTLLKWCSHSLKES
jgi:hypothetical protein